MPLNKQKGNMYKFVTHTWNPVKGRCSHDCAYCYMKRFGEQKPLRLDNTEFETDLGMGNFIFVGSSCDLFAPDVPSDWILKILEYCKKFQNKYLFQSKNPARFKQFISYFPENTVLGTTLESNRNHQVSKAPPPRERAFALGELSETRFGRMVTIEPILDFDIFPFLLLIKIADPNWINIGADSGNNNLPEPSGEKIQKLVKKLSEFFSVVPKENLKRLLGN